MMPWDSRIGGRIPKNKIAPTSSEAPTRMPISAPAATMMADPSKLIVLWSISFLPNAPGKRGKVSGKA